MKQENSKTSKETEKERIRKRYTKGRAENAEYIPAKEQKSLFDSDEEMRVAVYARVSTLNTQQTSSQVIQEKYYEDFVSRQKGWELVNIYSDEGISGTSLKNRDAFKQMIEDCQKGGIDLIVVKSVSRFTRNVKDGRASIDMLTDLNPPVGVWFENERIYSLSNDRAFILDLMMSLAAEESRAKSAAMEISLKMRFEHQILLTPPLLGYDNDENGELIVNEDEAKIVKLIFRMYQRGYSTKDIAEKLTALGLSTKAGNKIWSQGSVLGILQNEKHCGRVLTWKTFTTSYKTHKKRKNRGERDQYLYYDHHEAIISPDDFNAVQKMIANSKYGGHSFMPELYTITEGFLKGFVSVNPRWASFTPDDYRITSKKVSISDIIEKKPTINNNYQGYEIVRSQFLGRFNVVSITLTPTRTRIDTIENKDVPGEKFEKSYTIAPRIRISGATIKKFSFSEYVELLIHPLRKLAAVRICENTHKNAIKWGIQKNGSIYSRCIGGTAFVDTLYGLFDLKPSLKYRFRGAVKKIDTENIALFDLSEPEILSESGVIYPIEWEDSFGKDYYNTSDNNINEIGSKLRKYNTEPDIYPTSDKTITSEIKQLIEYFNENSEEIS
ncbi:MAG: recombinase family protein [Oscillospiraceae bacterium]|nr:recombinase family protein [Oscillospiraceae bacterium]